jgi:hypothetical protein
MNTLPVIVPLLLPSPAAMRLVDEQRAKEYQRDLLARIERQQQIDALHAEARRAGRDVQRDMQHYSRVDHNYSRDGDYDYDDGSHCDECPFDFRKLLNIPRSDTHYGHYTIIDTAIDMTTSYDAAVLIEFLRECIDLVAHRIEQINLIGRRHDGDDDGR